MDYIKREEAPPQLYPAVTEPLNHHIYQNQLPLNIVEQIQLAVQNNIIGTSDQHSFLIKNNLDQSHVILRDNVQILQNIKELSIERTSSIQERHLIDHRNTSIDHRNASIDQRSASVDQRNTSIDHRNVPIDHRNVQIDHRNTPIIQEHRSSLQNVIDKDLLEEYRILQDHRLQTQRIQSQEQGHRLEIDGRLNQGMLVQMIQGPISSVVLPDRMEAELPLPFQIKAEQDTEENPYFYDHMLQAYAGNGNIQMDHAPTNIVANAPNETQTLQYMLNGQIASINIPATTVDQYVRHQPFFQSYISENAESSAENLVVHRQYENVAYIADNLKRDRSELIEKLQDSIIHPNENVKPKNFYYDQECYGGKSENDASVQNKIVNADDVAYKSLIEQEYANIKGEYICIKCNGIFPSKRGLKQHSKLCNDNGEAVEKVGKFSCNQCSYKCQSPAILKIHERTHSGEKPFSCSFCEYKSGQKNNVAKHILVHMKEKPFRCQYCDYRCAQKNNLVVHERTHTGFKPFACTLCDYKTVQKPNLVKHMYLHTGQKPFSCDVCTYKCVQKTNLTKHKQRHLNEKAGEKIEYVNRNANRPYRPRQKTFKCDFCPFKSVQKQGLEKHVQFKHGGLECQVTELATDEFVPDKQFESGQGLNLMKPIEGSDVEDLCLRKEDLYAHTITDQAPVQIPT